MDHTGFLANPDSDPDPEPTTSEPAGMSGTPPARRKRGRPPRAGPPMSRRRMIRLPTAMDAALERLARTYGVTVSSLIRVAVASVYLTDEGSSPSPATTSETTPTPPAADEYGRSGLP